MSRTIDLAFQTDDGPILIQFSTPTPTPKHGLPWSIEVRTNGRPQTIAGENPMQALEFAARFAAIYLSGREGLDPLVSEPLPLQQAPDILAQGYRDGLVAVLDVRKIPCTDAARTRIAACADPAKLQRFLERAKTAETVDEVLADDGAAE